MPTLYKHFRDVPAAAWRWPNFKPEEIACRGSGELLVDEAALDKLQALRAAWGRPLTVNSGYRSAAHNRKVGGSPKSQHLEGKAFDLALTATTRAARDAEREALIRLAKAAGFTGIGRYDGFAHVDTGPKREWDRRGKGGGA